VILEAASASVALLCIVSSEQERDFDLQRIRNCNLTGTDANGSTEAAIQCSLPTMYSDGDCTGGGDSRAVFCGVGEAGRDNPKSSC